MGIWGGKYGPEGGRPVQPFAFTPSAVSHNQLVWGVSSLTYRLPFHRHVIQSGLNMAIMTLPSAQDHPLFYVGIYSLIGLATAVVTVLSIIVMYVGALRASRLLFRRLLNGVVHATMRWHVSPLGPLS
jgi:hypothetical protein